jgi:hypothetical protein
MIGAIMANSIAAMPVSLQQSRPILPRSCPAPLSPSHTIMRRIALSII